METNLITGIVIGVIIMAAIAYNMIRRLKSESRLARIAKLEVESDNILDSSIYRTKADRALIIKVHNGGGKIYAGVNKYASIIHESHSKKTPAIKEDFQGFKIDKTYMALIQKLASEKIVILETTTMEPSMLKRRHELNKIKSSILFKIKETEYGFYYGSFSSKSELDEFVGSSEYSILELEINKLRNIYSTAAWSKLLH